MAAHGVDVIVVGVDGSASSVEAGVAQRCACPVSIVPSAQRAEGGEA